MSISTYIAIAAITLGIGILGTVMVRAMSLEAEVETLTLANQALATSNAALQQKLDQTQQAAAVLQRQLEIEEKRAAEYDALREALINGGQDAALPQWFVDYLRQLGIGGLQPADADD